MANYLGFIDDTGVLAHDPNQRFFGLGFLKLEDTAPFYQEMVLLKDRVLSALPRLQKPFEFKFNEINRSNYKFYHDLVDLYFSFPQNYICIFVVDKMDSNYDISKIFPSFWNAYISYSGLVIKKNLDPNDRICIIADFHQKPKISTKYYETEIKDNPQVFNTCMLESHASLYIQMVDVLTSAVVSEFRCKYNPNFKPKECKQGVVNLVRNKLGVQNLAQKFTVTKPNYFSVLPFNPEDK